METKCIIPKDLIEDILPRLGVRDLLRFRCVCKSWRALIDDPTFICTHYNRHYDIQKAQGSVPLFLSDCNGRIDELKKCYILSKQLGEDILVNISADLVRDTKFLNYSDYDVDCIGVANGIICVRLINRSVNDNSRLTCGLWNPATRDLKIIPKPYRYMSIEGFGFHQFSNDFKVVASLGTIYNKKLSPYHVYSLSTNSWKKLPSLSYCFNPSQMDACFNGVYYWTTIDEPTNNFRYNIVSLNFSTEEFKVLDPPQCADLPAFPTFSYGALVPRISLYKECLALILKHKRRIDKKLIIKVHIWVVTKFDARDIEVPLEWQCVLAIEPFTKHSLGSCVRTSPMDGLILLLNDTDGDSWNDEWFLYDPETCKTKNLKIRTGDTYFYSFRYVESLFPLLRMVSQP